MQKKLIALAIAGLISAPAFAQSSVTLYGTIDYGYSWIGHSSVRESGDVYGWNNNDQWVKVHSASGNVYKGQHAINSGISKANRLGFKGVEDLGNGLKAVFVLETGLDGDVSGLFKGARQSYLALAGNFGTFAFGRQYTPEHLFTSAVDPFGKNGLGSAGNVLVQDRRLSNLAAYITPNFSGFNAVIAWTWNGADSQEIYDNSYTPGGAQRILPVLDYNRPVNHTGVGPNGEVYASHNHFNPDTSSSALPVDYPQVMVNGVPQTVTEYAKAHGAPYNLQVFAFAPSYTNGNLFAGLNYHMGRANFVNSHVSDVVALHDFSAYGSYVFGPVKVGATVGYRLTKKKLFNALLGNGYTINGIRDSKVLQAMLGATYSVTPNDKLQFSLGYSQESKVFNGESTAKITQVALGYEHSLSKRTALYAQGALQFHNSEFRDRGYYAVAVDGMSSVGSVGGSNVAGLGGDTRMRRGLAVGVRHDF